MKLLYQKLERSIQSHNVKLFEIQLDNLHMTDKILFKVLGNNAKFLTFNLLKTLFSHNNYNSRFFKSKTLMKRKKEADIKSMKENPYNYNFDDLGYQLSSSNYFLLKIINIINKKPKLIKKCISFIENNDYYIEYDSLALITFNIGDFELAIEYHNKNELNFIFMKMFKHNFEEIEIFKKIKLMSINKNKLDNF